MQVVEKTTIRDNKLSSLSVKITGIVFWGLVLIGLLVSFVILERYEQELVRLYQHAEQHLEGELQAYLEDRQALDMDKLRQRLQALCGLLNIPAASLMLGQERLLVGTLTEDQDAHFHNLSYVDAAGVSQGATLGVYQAKVAVVVDHYRKTFLMSMGALLFLFGFVLKWVLEKVLTQPFLQMVKVAKHFATDPTVRFNQGREDEFGDLARFINQSLDHLWLQQQKLSYQACHDSLTGLYNRDEFERHLQLALASATRQGAEHALCYLDLDQFKVVNDTCGHVAGDDLLRSLSDLLQGRIRETDILARLGGDEFGVLLQHASLADAERIANTLRLTVSEFRFVWQDKIFEIGVSIGLVGINRFSEDLTDVLSAADVACYSAKDAGRNRIHVYEQDDVELQKRRGEMQWVSRLQSAMENDAFCLYYQKIQPLQSYQPQGEHVELLLRMQDSESGSCILPGAFLPSAERYDLIRSIDMWVIKHFFIRYGDAIRRRYAANPLHHDTYGINLSGKSIDHIEFRRFLVDSIVRYEIPAKTLCFEITETAAITNLAGARHFIEELKNLGCQLALDDFGSGMSSFSYLKNLAVDFLKIDGSYVRDVSDDPVDRALVSSVNQIGHVMGMKTIAEYAQDQACLSVLKAIGVDYAQGYSIAEPQPIEGFFA